MGEWEIMETGWNEPVATSASVQDEVIQVVLGMNKKTHPLLLPRDFSAPFSILKFSPPTYLPLPTSLTSFLVHSIVRVQENFRA
jgi:hypothetical protein